MSSQRYLCLETGLTYVASETAVARVDFLVSRQLLYPQKLRSTFIALETPLSTVGSNVSLDLVIVAATQGPPITSARSTRL